MFLKSLVLAFTLITVSWVACCGQNVLILTNGHTRDFKRWKLSKDYVRIVGINGEKTEIPVSEVHGYFDRHNQTQYYRRPGKSDYLFDANQLPYEFVERIISGRINLYKSVRVIKPVLVTPAPGVNPQIEYLIEKDDAYESVLRGETSKREARDLLQSFLHDDPELLAKVTSPEFKVNLKTISSLLNEYNVRSFRPASEMSGGVGSIGLFFKRKQTSKNVLLLTVNDSLTYSLPENKVVTVQIPVDVLSKVCVVTGSTKVCNVMSASPFMMLYAEVNVTDTSVEMERLSSKEAMDYLAYIKKQ